MANPAQFDLLFGRPAPGYHAPPETTPVAQSNMAIFAEAVDEVNEPVSLDEVIRIFATLHGLVVLELHGHLPAMVPDPAALYEAAISALTIDLERDPSSM